jgi:hypothetical protein
MKKKKKQKQNLELAISDNGVDKIGNLLLLLRFLVLLILPISIIVKGFIDKNLEQYIIGFILGFIMIALYDELMEI